MNTIVFSESVYLGLDKGDWSAFEGWVATESTLTYKEELPEEFPLDDAIIDLVLNLMSDRNYSQNKNLYRVLIVIEQNWGVMTEHQKTKLLDATALLLTRTTQYMTVFCLIEILSEFFCDARALTILDELRSSSPVAVRSLLPFGYSTLIAQTTDADLKKQALASLSAMQEDTSETVREEAKKTLSKSPNR